MRKDKMNDSEQLDLLIAKAKEVGVLTERLRIIKLLEDYSDGELLAIPTGAISALIKGEQK